MLRGYRLVHKKFLLLHRFVISQDFGFPGKMQSGVQVICGFLSLNSFFIIYFFFDCCDVHLYVKKR